ncbi:MAG TPA: hypothetical protein IAB01_04115 [Candidatus Avidesulfovibrio excrementigallinarum]|nr:hypothetical protein [Candidatus Avidesulfovibrio excrementigallinarum]
MIMLFQAACRSALAVCLGIMLTSCAPATPPAQPLPDPVTSNAEQLVAKARILWGHNETCSNPEQAIAYLNSALELTPANAYALLLRGRAYNQLNLAEKAFEDLTSSIRLAPTTEAYTWRAFVLLREGNLRGARVDLESAFSLGGDLRHAYNIRGLLHLEEGDESAACDDFEDGADAGSPVWFDKARQAGLCR